MGLRFSERSRQVFAGWVLGVVWAGADELVLTEGKSDLVQVFWRIRADGSERRQLPLSIPLGGFAWEPSPSTNFDISPDGRRLVVQAREQSEADIGLIENVR